MSPGGYTVEVTGLSPNATEKDVYDFFAFSGAIEHVEIIRSGEYACTAYVTFKDPHALETAVLLTCEGVLYADEDISARYGKKYQRRKKMVENASLWLDQPFLGLIHQNYEDPPLGQLWSEDTPLDRDPRVQTTRDGGPANYTLEGPEGDEQLKSFYEDSQGTRRTKRT